METMLLAFFSILCFCLCCHQFIRQVMKPIPPFRLQRAYAHGAMRLGKFYVSAAWGAMTVVFLASLVISFKEVFTTF